VADLGALWQHVAFNATTAGRILVSLPQIFGMATPELLEG
jgi:hypothetical protein